VAAENIDNTVNGTGLFNVKIPGLSDAADIQAALRLYHYGIYGYDGANTDPTLLPNPSIAKYLQNLIDADAAEITNRNSAIAAHNGDTTDVHGIANTANLATQAFVTTSITNAVNGATGGYPDLAGEAIDWNSVDLRFDVEPRIANTGTIVTKTESFTLSPDDVGKTAILYSSSPMIVTLPANASVEIPVGYSIDIIQTGTGSVTVSEESNDVLINSKSNIKSLDGQYSKGTLVKIDDNTWFFFGNLLNAVTPVAPIAPTPVAPTPTAPTPVAPTPTAPTAPTPTAPTPVAPTAPTPVAPTPVAPTPVAPTPVEPTPTPTPTTNYYGYCALNGTAQGPFATSNTCQEAYDIQENANGYPPIGWVCGSTEAAGTPSCSTTTPTPVAPTPVAPTPVAPTPSFAIDSISSTTNSITYSWSNAPAGTVSYDVYYADNDVIYPTTTTGSTSKTFSGLASGTPHTVFVRAKDSSNSTLASDNASINTQAVAPTPVAPTAPTPVAPTPVAPTPVAPTPVAPTPVAPVPSCPSSNVYGITQGGVYSGSCPDGSCPGCTNYQDNWYKCSDGSSGVKFYTGLGCTTPTAPVAPVAPTAPTPTAPTPVAPTPVAPTAPTPTAPTPTAPTPTAPTPVAPTPVACTPGSDCGTTTDESICKTTVREYNSSCNCVVVGIYNFC
jgi:hypothetical protein